VTTRPLHLPAHLPDADGPLWKLPVGDGRFVGPRDQVEALGEQLAVHAEQVAAVRVAEALEEAREDEYERWLPVLQRSAYPKYLNAGVIPQHVTDRFESERTGAV
jgi:hypothetical protein